MNSVQFLFLLYVLSRVSIGQAGLACGSVVRIYERYCRSHIFMNTDLDLQIVSLDVRVCNMLCAGRRFPA